MTPRAEQLTKHQQRTLEEQEDLSIEQQMAQRYKAFEAEQRRKEASAQGRHDAEAMRRKLEEQEDLSIEQQMAQQVIVLGYLSSCATYLSVYAFVFLLLAV